VAEAVKAEGWKWVEALPQFDHDFTAEMRRVYPAQPEIPEADQERRDNLQAEYEALCEAEELSADEEAQAARLEQEIAVNRPRIGTPYRLSKGTPLSGGFWR